MKRITAKYSGTCCCGWEWDAGDPIYWEPGEPPICERCGRDEEERIQAEQRRNANNVQRQPHVIRKLCINGIEVSTPTEKGDPA